MSNLVIGIEGLVGSGKTSICKELLKKIPNSIILHGGNIYRAIVYAMMNSGIELNEIKEKSNNIDVMKIIESLGIEIKLENNETVIYMKGKKINEEDLQSDKSSMAVSIVSNVANNSNLYKFGKNIIDEYKKDYNVILSSRDIVRMYPEVDYHFFIVASLDERVRRKYIQYNKILTKEEVEKNIKSRDELQEKSGYYKTYDLTKKIDVTNCTIEEGAEKVMKYIKLPILN